MSGKHLSAKGPHEARGCSGSSTTASWWPHGAISLQKSKLNTATHDIRPRQMSWCCRRHYSKRYALWLCPNDTIDQGRFPVAALQPALLRQLAALDTVLANRLVCAADRADRRCRSACPRTGCARLESSFRLPLVDGDGDGDGDSNDDEDDEQQDEQAALQLARLLLRPLGVHQCRSAGRHVVARAVHLRRVTVRCTVSDLQTTKTSACTSRTYAVHLRRSTVGCRVSESQVATTTVHIVSAVFTPDIAAIKY